MSKQWTELPERGTRSALLLIRWIARVLGRTFACALLWPVAAYFLATGHVQRKASRAFLSRALGRPPGIFEQLKHFHCYSVTVLDRVYLLDGHTDRFDVCLHNREVALAHMSNERGCLLLGAHVGSFEIMRAIGITHKGFPLRILMNETHNSVIASVFNEQNPQMAGSIIPLGATDALLRAKESVDEGYMLGALGDRVLNTDKVLSCPFFGDDAQFPLGPISLAAALQVPVVLFVSLYRGGNRYDVHFETLSEGITSDRRERRAQIDACTRLYARRLEYFVNLAPNNWFNFYDFWADFR